MNRFVHLHLHTEYSLSDSTIRIKQLVAAAVEDGMEALAITDVGNVYGVVKFYKACMSVGIKPIIGAEVWIDNPVETGLHDKFVLLAQNNQGYIQLCKLLTESILHNKHLGRPLITQSELMRTSSDLLAIHHSSEGELRSQIIHPEQASAYQALQHYQALFSDRLYLEIARVGQTDELLYQRQILSLAERLSIPLLAVNRVQFATFDDFDAQPLLQYNLLSV